MVFDHLLEVGKADKVLYLGYAVPVRKGKVNAVYKKG